MIVTRRPIAGAGGGEIVPQVVNLSNVRGTPVKVDDTAALNQSGTAFPDFYQMPTIIRLKALKNLTLSYVSILAMSRGNGTPTRVSVRKVGPGDWTPTGPVLAISDPVPVNPGITSKYLFTLNAPVTFTAGEAFVLICDPGQGGNALFEAAVSSAFPTPYRNLNGAIEYYGTADARTGVPVQIELGYTADLVKNVNGPLDSRDFPGAAAEADLALGGVAILREGANPPRLAARDGAGLWYGGPFTRSKSSGGSGGYAPTYQTPFTVTNSDGVTVERVARLTLTTSRALANGRDIRVERLTSGQSPQATARTIASVRQVSGGYEYTVLFFVTLTAGETANFRATYGDASAPEPTYPAAEVALLGTYSQGRKIGNMWAYLDARQAYVPADFAGAGVQIVGQRDDQSNEIGLDGRSVRWNDTDYTSLFHFSNGGLRFGGSGEGANSTRTPNDLQFLSGDAYESWRRLVTLPDGLAFHILTGRGGYTADQRYTIRYVLPGRWIMTVLERVPGLGSFLSARVAGEEFTQNTPDTITADNPRTLVVEFPPLGATVGGETAFA